MCVNWGGHFDKWPVYGAVTLRMSTGKSFPTSISVCFSMLVYVGVYVCVQRAAIFWSSDCEPVVWRMINQTDWTGQIWFVIAQKKKKGGGVGLLCEREGVDVCTCVMCLCAKGAEVCMKGPK